MSTVIAHLKNISVQKLCSYLQGHRGLSHKVGPSILPVGQQPHLSPNFAPSATWMRHLFGLPLKGPSTMDYILPLLRNFASRDFFLAAAFFLMTPRFIALSIAW